MRRRDADDCIRAELGRVLEHAIERVLAGLLAKVREQGDVPAYERLKTGSMVLNTDRERT